MRPNPAEPRSRASGSPGSLGPRRTAAAAAVVALLSVTAATTPAGAQTILNVERLQPQDVEAWHWGVEGSLSVSAGNSDYVDVFAGVVLGHRWPGDWLRMFAGLDYRSEGGDKVDYDRYLHLRLTHRLAGRWQTFHFVQFQASHASLLRQRILLGSGVRRRLLGDETTLDVGTGAMWEREDLDPDRDLGDHPVEARVWRMANLVVATHPLTESVRLIAVSYIQPELSEFEDLRVLADLSLRIGLTENVDLTVRNEWRHDSRPPEGVEPDDYVLSTGFTVSFR